MQTPRPCPRDVHSGVCSGPGRLYCEQAPGAQGAGTTDCCPLGSSRPTALRDPDRKMRHGSCPDFAYAVGFKNNLFSKAHSHCPGNRRVLFSRALACPHLPMLASRFLLQISQFPSILSQPFPFFHLLNLTPIYLSSTLLSSLSKR